MLVFFDSLLTKRYPIFYIKKNRGFGVYTMSENSKFKSVVFAGGGSRCFWQLGFWNTAAAALNIRPSAVSGVSGGAAFACFSISGDAAEILTYFKKLTGANRKNFYPSNLFRKESVFPHYEMYKDAILHSLNDVTIKKILNGPDIRILIARPPGWMGAWFSAFTGVVLYNIEKHILHPLHPVFSSIAGFRGEVVSIKKCRTREEVADLILESSCMPPFMPVMRRNNDVVLDGGLIDNVPISILDDCEGEKLVLLTRHYKDKIIPKNDGITYVQPSEIIPITKWEYTDPDGLQYVYDLGRRDGEKFAKKLKTAR